MSFNCDVHFADHDLTDDDKLLQSMVTFLSSDCNVSILRRPQRQV